MEQTVYQVCGFKYGTFTDNNGRTVNYCNLFVIAPIGGTESDDYHFAGHEAFKFRCVSPSVLDGINLRDKVHLFFDPRGRVVLIANANEN